MHCLLRNTSETFNRLPLFVIGWGDSVSAKIEAMCAFLVSAWLRNASVCRHA